MTNVVFFRPKTGADSVPFPAECHGPETPQAMAAWARYQADCDAAAKRETADEAIVRSREEASFYFDGAARLDYVLDALVDSFDRHVRDLSGPDGERERCFGFGEVCLYSDVRDMSRAWHEMDSAYAGLDRERFRKAAAEYARVLADLTVGMRVAETSEQGGQA